MLLLLIDDRINTKIFFFTEEGIDVGSCNLVIRFSELKNNREFVQSKGRARARGSFYVILDGDSDRTSRLIDLFQRTEKFLSGRFQQNEKEIRQARSSVLPDGYEVTTNDEVFRLPNESAVYHNEAAAFLQRYILKKGNQNHTASYEFEPQEPAENEPCVAKLNLTGVTPLKEEIRGQVYLTKKDAFKSGRPFDSNYFVIRFGFS